MGANRFLKLGGAGIGFRAERDLFLSPPVHIQAPPILGGLDINWGGLNYPSPPKIGGLGY